MDRLDASVGTTVTVSGRLVVTGDDTAFLTADPAAFSRRHALLIRDGSLIAKHLLETLPAYLGGPFAYDEECIITGVVERRAGSPELHDIRRCWVRRDDVEIEVPVAS